jgi:hypothetical protein
MNKEKKAEIKRKKELEDKKNKFNYYFKIY